MIEVLYEGEVIPFYEVSDHEELRELIQPYKKAWSWKKSQYEDRAYFNVPCSFDIETTTYNMGTEENPKWIGFMYIWQFAFDNIAVCGRTWAEWIELLDYLKKWLNLTDYRRLPIYAHFAAFEFQFMRNFVRVEKVFARKKRVVVEADFNSAFQLRCSWALSNMSLGKAIGTVPNAHFVKQAGKDFDYEKVRLPNTSLTNMEYVYCLCDVLGLNEYLRHLLLEDDMTTIPMTSTGFIRRDVRSAVLENPSNRKQVTDLALTPRMYILCKTAARGGNCHANAQYANVELEDVKSKDRKSSYPAEMIVADNYPVSAFREIRPSKENLEEVIETSACLIDIVFYDLGLKAPTPIPYISIAKCTRVHFAKDDYKDNGRILKCTAASMVITELDYKIIDSQYKWSGIYINNLYIAKRGYLNKEFRLNLLEKFKIKCELEFGDQYLYNKFKNKINAYFGMMLTDICNPTITYDVTRDEPWKSEDVNIDALLSRYYGSPKSFQSYQHGIWVTANARYEHQLGINAAGADAVYGDTDSVKYVGEHEEDFKKVNERWLELCDKCDINPTVHANGKTYTLGLWETEKTADRFKTIGAKKYAAIYGDKLKITVAGLNKEDGAKWLLENGGLDKFEIGVEVPSSSSGRTISYYNDVKKPYKITIDGCEIILGSNIAVVPTTYTFGVSKDYLAYFTSIQ